MDRYEVDVLVNGKPVKQYLHNGNLYIEGRKGSKFTIRVKNNSLAEILAVPSVDGLSVMDGKPCSINESRGYIVKPRSVVHIDGWRTSDKEVAEFFFSTVEDSYAEHSEHGSKNAGIIGVALFEKKWDSWQSISSWSLNTGAAGGGGGGTFPYGLGGVSGSGTTGPVSINTLQASATSGLSMSLDRGDRVMMAASASPHLVSASYNKQDVATGWGAAKKSEIRRQYFGRKDLPEQIVKIYYNSREELERIGINLNRGVTYVTPEAFPGDYCKPPTR